MKRRLLCGWMLLAQVLFLVVNVNAADKNSTSASNQPPQTVSAPASPPQPASPGLPTPPATIPANPSNPSAPSPAAMTDPPPQPESFWTNAAWPSFPGVPNVLNVLKVTCITNALYSTNGHKIEFDLSFNATTNGDILFYDALATKKDSEALAALPLTNIIKVLEMSVKSGRQDSRNLRGVIDSVSPPTLNPHKNIYHVAIALNTDDLASLISDSNIVATLNIGTAFGEAYRAYFRAGAIWTSNRMSSLLSQVSLESSNQMKLYTNYFQESIIGSASYSEEYLLISHYQGISNIVTNADFKAQYSPSNYALINWWTTNGSSISKKLAFTSSNCLAILAGATSRKALSTLNVQLNDTSLVQEATNYFDVLFWSLDAACYTYNAHFYWTQVAGGTSTTYPLAYRTTVDLIIPSFPPNDQNIIGFTNLVQEIAQLPPKDAADNLGHGIADNFYVARVTFQNKTTNTLLLYGNTILYTNVVWAFEYTNSRALKFLRNHRFDDMDITTNTNGTVTWDCHNRIGIKIASGTVNKCIPTDENHPLPFSLVSSAFDLRQFHAAPTKYYRLLDTIANIGSSIVPIVGNNTYGNVASLFSGTGVPQVKNFFGQMTESQRQVFLTQSMPELLELKIGDTATRFVYISRYGCDVKTAGSVLFVAQLGEKQKFSITAAMIVKTAEKSGASTPADSSKQPEKSLLKE